jgi:hypothetical protein
MNSVDSCQSRELCFFNVLGKVRTFPVRNAFVQQWDKVLFPRVGLNYVRKHLAQPLHSGVIPLAVKAINNGNICRMITGRAPFDTDTSNAGLIFRLLKAEATLPLSGRKRSAPRNV